MTFETLLAKLRVAALAIVCLTSLGACDEGSENKPYLEIEGGGFVFNYRIAEAYYGFVARVVRSLPDGSLLEAEFENPAGGEPIVVRQSPRPGTIKYSFRTPPLHGVKADRDYVVELRVIDRQSENVIAQYASAFRSKIGQEVLPEQPLTVGPGYHRNPDTE